MSFPRPRGKVFRNPPSSGEAVAVPSPFTRPDDPAGLLEEDLYGQDGQVGGDGAIEGGRQIDPALVARARIQALQKEMDGFLEREKELRDRLESLKKEREEERRALDEEGKALREAARKECKALQEKARKEGQQKGYGEGLARAVAEVEARVRQEYGERFGELLGLMEGSVRRLEEERQALLDQNGPMLVRLWQTMLERFLRREVEFDGDTALRVFREVLGRVSDRTRIRVFFNPLDRDIFSARENEFAEIRRVAEQFDVIADEGIERGGCLVETNLGVYDARWHSQIEALSREIDELIGEGRDRESQE